MKIHRFNGTFPRGQGVFRIEDEEVIWQIRNVLRMQEGNRLILADGKGKETLCVLHFRKNALEAAPIESWQNTNEPEIQASLYCAILKRENFELVVQKATEIGVGAIIPVKTARTVKQNIRQERLAKIAKEAAEQSGRGVVPEILLPMDFDKAADHTASLDSVFFFHQEESPFQQKTMQKRIGMFIGPEGGWAEEEIREAKQRNWNSVSLGALTLRAESAAIIASYLVIHPAP